MTDKALDYAENKLGVHLVYDEARTAHKALDEVYTALSNAGDNKRDLLDRVHDQEQVIASDERGKHPDMSAAGMEKHLKMAFAADGDLKSLRDQLRKVLNDIDGLEYDAKSLENGIKIAVARMTELGGYFQYLAAVKNAKHHATTT